MAVCISTPAPASACLKARRNEWKSTGLVNSVSSNSSVSRGVSGRTCLERRPLNRPEVADADATEDARDQRHRLPLEHSHGLTLLGLFPGQVARKLIVGQHSALACVHLCRRGAHSGNYVLGQQLVAPQFAQDGAHVVLDVRHQVLAQAALSDEHGQLAHVRGGHLGHELAADGRRGEGAQGSGDARGSDGNLERSWPMRWGHLSRRTLYERISTDGTTAQPASKETNDVNPSSAPTTRCRASIASRST